MLSVVDSMMGQPLSESVVVNANNTVKNVFVYVKEGLEGKSFSVHPERTGSNGPGWLRLYTARS